MKKQNKKGFTLIELLAVIVILSIIALIAVPVVMNIITKAQKSAFKDTAYGIIKAGELHYADKLLEPEGMTSNKTFTFPDDVAGLDINGRKPSSGTVIVTTEGKVAIGITDGKYCVTKGFDDSDVTMTEDADNCYNPEGPKTLSQLTTSTHACAKKGEKCNIKGEGTMFTIQVNDETPEDFYVIADDGNKVTLILNRNLYAEGNTTEPDVKWYDATPINDAGPITALEALRDRTKTWNNLPIIEVSTYEYSSGTGSGTEKKLGSSSVFKMYGRLPKHDELDAVYEENGSFPDYLVVNLFGSGDDNTSGYWTSTADSGNARKAFYMYVYKTLSRSDIDVSNAYGVRPVIELYK